MNINSLVISFDTHLSFWEVNPQLKDVGVFKGYYVKDKSKNKLESSRLMWFVANCYDLKSQIYNIPEADRIQMICEDILEEPLFYKNNSEAIELCRELYCKLQDTPGLRQLRVWNKKMEEKNRFMETTPYTEESWEMLDKMMANNVAAYKNLQQILEMMTKDESSSSSRGGEVPTLSDSGLI